MENADKALLQLCYAGALVDAANNYALLGATGKIEEKKARSLALDGYRLPFHLLFHH
jgi:hypothetical protein